MGFCWTLVFCKWFTYMLRKVDVQLKLTFNLDCIFIFQVPFLSGLDQFPRNPMIFVDDEAANLWIHFLTNLCINQSREYCHTVSSFLLSIFSFLKFFELFFSQTHQFWPQFRAFFSCRLIKVYFDLWPHLSFWNDFLRDRLKFPIL